MLVLAQLAAVDSSSLRSAGTGSKSTQDDYIEAGIVTADTHQSATTVITRAWNSGSSSSRLGDDNSVTFTKLGEQGTKPDVTKRRKKVVYRATTDKSIQPMAFNSKDKDASRNYTRNVEKNSSFRKKAYRPRSKSQIKLPSKLKPYKPTIIKVPSVVRATTPPPTLAPNLVNLNYGPSSFLTVPETALSTDKIESASDIKFGSTKSAESLDDNEVTTENRSFDQTIVLVIVGVVGAIGALLLVASRQIMKEMSDDKDLSDL
ncbi:hypothetical protein CCR75_004692 [Bremia lactucae]|uniref:Uncharacterized protein n=1 Tax=Bremia lactucae TaxID=4779 RepID=A0A976IHT4_BRELC|nr:hypothetical protein CCR75_004692 [Bremia lactucae]